MTSPVKDRKAPLVVLGANIALYLIVLGVDVKLLSTEPIKLLQLLLPSGGAVVFGTVLNLLLDVDTKNRIVSLRWHHALPGARAFTLYGPRDPRIDMKRLKAKLDSLPSDPDEQNRLWYRLYSEIRETSPSVRDALRSQLTMRDYTALAAMFVFTLGPAALIGLHGSKLAWIYLGVLVAQFLLVRQSAQNVGIRLVTNVLAEVSVRP